MSFNSYFLLMILFVGSFTEAHALECWGRIGYFREPFSNKCMDCQKPSFSDPGQANCKFPNTDHCCESDLCNETNPNFSNWINEECEVP